jgi:cell division protein FtsA
MNQSEYVAALDIGTSKMVAIAARKDAKGDISILASEKEESENCIRRGCVHNGDKASEKASGLIRKLNDKLKARSCTSVEKIYIGIGGQSIHTEEYKIKKEIPDGEISPELLDSIDREINEYKPDFAEVLEILPPQFYLDEQPVSNPKGHTGAAFIEAHFLLIVGSPSLKRNLTSTLQNKMRLPNVGIAGFFISPLATAEAVLTDKNKESGCALVEFGAGVTYLSIYKGGRLKYLVTIPLGASVITKDITQLNISEKEAEELKIKYGKALIEYDNDGKVTAPEIARREELKLFDYVIEARTEEIIANLKNQIIQSGYESSLNAGIIMTGGGASLKSLAISLNKKTGIRVSAAKNQFVDSATEIAGQPGYATIIGLLSLSKENCAKEVVVLPKPEPIPVVEQTSEPKQEPTPPASDEKASAKETTRRGLFGRIKRQVDSFTGELFPDN